MERELTSIYISALGLIVTSSISVRAVYCELKEKFAHDVIDEVQTQEIPLFR